MKKVLFRRKYSLKKKQKFKDENRVLVNPYQGWYRLYIFDLSLAFDANETHWCLHEEEALCLVECSLEAYVSGDLPEDALQRLHDILQFYLEENKQVILRFAYDFEGNAMSKEPTSLDLVLLHMKQVASIAKEYQSMILCYQGLFIGNWGEMHGSRYATDGCLKQLYQGFRESFGPDVILALRRLEWMERWMKNDAKVTLFDDGIFGSENDMGTFLGTRADGLSRITTETACLPVGGELLSHGLMQEMFSPNDILQSLKAMHISYLNSQYDMKALEHLDQVGMLEKIQKNLGYRLLVTAVSCEKENLVVSIQNTGWGDFFYPMTVSLQVEEDESVEDILVSSIPSGATVDVMFSYPSITGALVLRGQLQKKYDITFANEGGTCVNLGELRYA